MIYENKSTASITFNSLEQLEYRLYHMQQRTQVYVFITVSPFYLTLIISGTLMIMS